MTDLRRKIAMSTKWQCQHIVNAERGDMPRSRYIMRLLEKVLQTGPTSGGRADQFIGTERSIQQGSDSADG